MRKSRFSFVVGLSPLSSSPSQKAPLAQSSSFSESFTKAFRTAFQSRSISQCVARVLAAASLSVASPAIAAPLVYSPVVVQPAVPSTPGVITLYAYQATGKISDAYGFVRAVTDCQVENDYPSYRMFPAGTIFHMIINPNANPAGGDPSVWGTNYKGEYVQGVYPVDADPATPGAEFYVPMKCLEGVQRL
jgi:hypothetical protein